jgi:putative MATE family efflux protein
MTIKRDMLAETLRIASPAIAESLFTAVIGFIDSFMVSSLGANAVAAIGLTNQPKYAGFTLFYAVNIAVATLVARRNGQKNRIGANALTLTAILWVILLSAAMSTLLFLFAPAIMNACGATSETHAAATSYYRIVMGCMVFSCIQMVINAAQRGAGNTKITMRTNMAANIVNIVFDYLLIGGHMGFPALGIRGAAAATVIGTAVGCVISIASLLKKDEFLSIPLILGERIRTSRNDLRAIFRLGWPISIEQVLTRVGLVATSILAAACGNHAMAAHQVAMNILVISYAFGDGLQAAAVALVGRSLGENKPRLAAEYGRICRDFGLGVSAVLAFLLWVSASALYALFFEEAEIIAIGIQLMPCLILTVIFQIIMVVYAGCLRGAGDIRYITMAALFSVVIVRTGVSYVFGNVLGMGVAGVWCGVMADQFFRCFLCMLRFRSGKWTSIRI